MTAACTYDLLRIRTEEEAREMYGDLWNRRRRRGMEKDEKVEAEVVNGDVSASLGVKEKKRRFLGEALGR
ncbi:hypothetical protein BO83DRAFT_377513 [Aspergillus eucalypticola CBS 122712]|uniref:Uncharacterized protein n=1 Tax=Aspergillus eucalypticola (strain CBS 122712 / IBT 29274) TaxID=1448314 RepID=A0A317VR78_ASPEC|nr:uncharacterized protein BO83DRAFT_377513 [Aspergillus eucalypticola CBS 122712]PWY75791.1 hypothetical protein BO83DRAFT_377513 [Aspergillus eucalypticola CBS 122712]